MSGATNTDLPLDQRDFPCYSSCRSCEGLDAAMGNVSEGELGYDEWSAKALAGMWIVSTQRGNYMLRLSF